MSSSYISPRRIIKKRLQRLILEVKKHIHRYQHALTIMMTTIVVGLGIYMLYRYFLGSSIWHIHSLSLDSSSTTCYPDPLLHRDIVSSLSGSQYRPVRLGFYPPMYQAIQAKYPVIGDIVIKSTEQGYILSYRCNKPSLVRHIGSKLIGSRSGVFLPLDKQSLLLTGVRQAWLPYYIQSTDLTSLYHVIPESTLSYALDQITRYRGSVTSMYLIGSDKIQITTPDQKNITLSISQSISDQYEAVDRLSRHYFDYKYLKTIDCSNLNHIVVKK